MKGQLLDFEVICAEAPAQGAVVVVDPFSTGALVAAGVVKRGLRLVIVWSDAATRAAVDDMQHTIREEGGASNSGGGGGGGGFDGWAHESDGPATTVNGESSPSRIVLSHYRASFSPNHTNFLT